MDAHFKDHVVIANTKNNSRTHPILVSKREAARLLNLCVRTIEKLINSKELRTKRVGKRVLLLLEDLERFARETSDLRPASR